MAYALRVLTPPSSSCFIDLASVKQRLGVSGTDQDAELARWIQDASAAIRGRIGFDPGLRVVEERHRHGRSSQYLQLSAWPIERASVEVVAGEVALSGVDVWDAANGMLYREAGWPCDLTVTYVSGYLMPDQVQAWGKEVEIAAGTFARSSKPSGLRFEATESGTTGTGVPVWPTTAGDTVADGSVTWTAREVPELPDHLVTHAFAVLLHVRAAADREPGLASESIDGVETSWFASHLADELPSNVLSVLDRFRAEHTFGGVA